MPKGTQGKNKEKHLGSAELASMSHILINMTQRAASDLWEHNWLMCHDLMSIEVSLTSHTQTSWKTSFGKAHTSHMENR